MKKNKNKNKIIIPLSLAIITTIILVIVFLLPNSENQMIQTIEPSLTQAYRSSQSQETRETISAPALTVTKDATNPLLVHLTMQDVQTTITKFKIAKVRHIEEKENKMFGEVYEKLL